MSSYFPSFNYLGINSRDRNLVVSHFDADVGESDTFLGMESIYTESADGTRRLDYGAKFNNVASFRITVIKPDSSDFSIEEVREHLKWMTGVRKNSTLELAEHFTEDFIGYNTSKTFSLVNTCDKVYHVAINGVKLASDAWTYDKQKNSVTLKSFPKRGDKIEIAYNRVKYSFVGRITNAWQYKMDSRTVGLIFEFTSVSPWAYSAKQTVNMPVSGPTTILIQNDTDDLYGYTPVNTIFENSIGTSLTITNNSTGDETTISKISANEVITLSNNMMITSDKPNKKFGNTFNFVFPRLCAGENEFVVDGTGRIIFEYVYCIKIGDCAMDINVISDPIYDDDGNIQLDTLPFSRIVDLPTSFQAYNIKNVYSKTEVDMLVAGIEIDEAELNAMLVQELN